MRVVGLVVVVAAGCAPAVDDDVCALEPWFGGVANPDLADNAAGWTVNGGDIVKDGFIVFNPDASCAANAVASQVVDVPAACSVGGVVVDVAGFADGGAIPVRLNGKTVAVQPGEPLCLGASALGGALTLAVLGATSSCRGELLNNDGVTEVDAVVLRQESGCPRPGALIPFDAGGTDAWTTAAGDVETNHAGPDGVFLELHSCLDSGTVDGPTRGAVSIPERAHNAFVVDAEVDDRFFLSVGEQTVFAVTTGRHTLCLPNGLAGTTQRVSFTLTPRAPAKPTPSKPPTSAASSSSSTSAATASSPTANSTATSPPGARKTAPISATELPCCGWSTPATPSLLSAPPSPSRWRDGHKVRPSMFATASTRLVATFASSPRRSADTKSSRRTTTRIWSASRPVTTARWRPSPFSRRPPSAPPATISPFPSSSPSTPSSSTWTRVAP